jgi:hypothetical protein
VSAEAIFQTTLALRTRLQQALTAATDPGTVFIGPLDDPDALGASLILFLYRIMPSATLRNREHRVPADNPPPPFIVFNNSLPLDLYYLVTVGTRAGSSEEPLLRTLGFAMRELNTNPELTGTAVGQETVSVSLEPLTTEEASRIWSLFPTANYRTSVAYLATPVWIDPALPPVQAARVMQDKLRAGARATEAEGV